MRFIEQIIIPRMRFIALALVVAFGFWGATFSTVNTPFELPIALADAHYGILDQAAPELNLNEWIDGNGQKTGSIRLADQRGKVVYLYFFQDW